MKSIIKSFSEHGTFIQSDTLDYILSKDDPKEFTSFITKNLKEFPLVLTIDHIKNLEESTKTEETPKPSIDSPEVKELQTKMLSSIYGGEVQYKPSTEIEIEYDDPDKEDQIKLPDEEPEETKPQVIETDSVSAPTWKQGQQIFQVMRCPSCLRTFTVTGSGSDFVCPVDGSALETVREK